MRRFAWALLLCIGGAAVGQQPAVVVKPQPFHGVLTNPGIGFTTFQRFNGDALNAGTKWTEGFPIDYQPFHGKLQAENFPDTTVAYFRIYWRFIEPEKGMYHWEVIDKAIQTARERHQTLMLRIAPYGTDAKSDVPAWYREITGEVYGKPVAEKYYAPWFTPVPVGKPGTPNEKNWAVNPMNPAYAQYFGALIRELGKRYDGDPDLDLVDISIVGAWGEGAGTPLLTKHTRNALMDSYLDTFHKTPLVIQPTDRRTVEYALSKANVGWRADCLGDMGGFSKQWNIEDAIPQQVIGYGLADAWKKAPVSMEACWVMQTWKDKGWDLGSIMKESLQLHMSTFNAKSSAVPKAWQPQVNEWLKRMGYRFDLRRFTYPPVVGPNRKLEFTSWWENKGDAPCYRKFPFALRLKNAAGSAVMATGADIRTWMPGDNLYDGAVFIPANLPDGQYELDVAIVDPDTHKPKVKLAIEGMEPDGWYRLGNIQVQQSLPQSQSASTH